MWWWWLQAGQINVEREWVAVVMSAWHFQYNMLGGEGGACLDSVVHELLGQESWKGLCGS